jgi:uncharacterized membrane protein YgaE (UPF0421/DUF939 family)
MIGRLLRGRDYVGELQLAVKMTVGGTLAWWLAVELGAKRPIFAALVPLVAITGDPFAAVSVSVSRILGVFAGVGLGLAFLHVGGGTTWRVAAILALGTLAGILLKVGPRPNIEVPIAALFVVGFGSSNARELGVQRIWETAIGAAVSIVIASFIWPPHPLRALQRQLNVLRQELAADLMLVAEDLATGNHGVAGRLDEVREHSRDAVREVFALDDARRALRWSPLRRQDVAAVDILGWRTNLAARVYRHTRALARDVADATPHDPALAEATRHLADASDRLLTGREAAESLERAESALAAGQDVVVASQLRQLMTDLQHAARMGDPGFEPGTSALSERRSNQLS